MLLKRVDHEEFWQSVTGSMEWSETRPMETARREIQEELGITAIENLRDLTITNEYKILPQWRYRYKPGIEMNREHAFTLEMPAETGVTLNPEEHDKAQWLDFREAAKKASSWTNRAVIETIGHNLGLGAR